MSAVLFPNTTTPNFPYIIPCGQTQECDIYGLACQTGSITVGMDLTTATITTVLPCSSYLTAQSSYLVSAGPFRIEDQATYDPAMTWSAFASTGIVKTWDVNFGRSPECRSFAQDYSKSLYIFSNCGSSNTVFSTQVFRDSGDSFGYPPQIPPGLLRRYDEYYWDICYGTCKLEFSELRLYYFLDGNATECQYNGTFKFNSASTSGNLGRRMQSLIRIGSTAVVGEHTLYVA